MLLGYSCRWEVARQCDRLAKGLDVWLLGYITLVVWLLCVGVWLQAVDAHALLLGYSFTCVVARLYTWQKVSNLFLNCVQERQLSLMFVAG